MRARIKIPDTNKIARFKKPPSFPPVIFVIQWLYMTVTDILSKYDEKTATLASELRSFLLTVLPGIQEMPDNSSPLIGYGYGTGYKDLISTILISKAGVKLGFYKGTELPDPRKLLTGTGKVHRYVEIKLEQDMKKPPIKKLVADALNAYYQRKK
jgi:hypothetical protein